MEAARRPRLLTLLLLALLVLAAGGLAVLYPLATRLVVERHQQPLVERTVRQAAATFSHSPDDQRRITFPIVMELSDRTCVELRSTEPDRGGNYIACYSRGGEMIQERVTVGF